MKKKESRGFLLFKVDADLSGLQVVVAYFPIQFACYFFLVFGVINQENDVHVIRIF